MPVDGEELGAPETYGADRVFVHIGVQGAAHAPLAARLAALADAGHPVLRLTLGDVWDLGQEFFRWEFATAVAGHLLGVNPFDEPNVQESKDNAAALLRDYQEQGEFPEGHPTVAEGLLSVYGGGENETVAAALRGFCAQVGQGDYVALMAYLLQDDAVHGHLQTIRRALRTATGAATTLGYGPRFLHSTGQLHKGGPNTAVCLQLTADVTDDLPIPGMPYTFGTFIAAQSLGDVRSLAEHGRRVLRVHLGADYATGLAALADALSGLS